MYTKSALGASRSVNSNDGENGKVPKLSQDDAISPHSTIVGFV